MARNTRPVGLKNIAGIIGGPPCQGFTTAGKRDPKDPRNSLFKEFVRFVNVIQPKFFVMENVKGILSMKTSAGESVKKLIETELEKCGYDLTIMVLNAADYGVPQSRIRVFFIGFRKDLNLNIGEPLHKPRVTAWEAIGDLPSLVNNVKKTSYNDPPSNAYQRASRNPVGVLMDHEKPIHNAKMLQIIKLAPINGKATDIPKHLLPKNYFNTSYTRMDPNNVSTTIIKNFGTPSSGKFIHPYEDRGLTTREGARLQSFPDSFEFYGTRMDKNMQIGNAVPPLLAEAIAGKIKEVL